MNIQLESLRPDPRNARRVVSNDDANGMAASLKILGQLQPIVVRPDPGPDGGWLIVAGNRRVAGARLLGWQAVEAVERNDLPDEMAQAVSAAENMARKPMHPVDQWRAVKAMIDEGMSIELAADALGLPLRLARRLAKLGTIAPELLELMLNGAGLPRDHDLALIAAASAEQQIAALEAARREARGQGVTWFDVARRLQVARIPQARAIFDHGLIAWDEDLFAEPGSEDQFTTTEIEAFLDLQIKALTARAEASRGRIVMVGVNRATGEMAPPAGWEFTWDEVPKRWRRDDPRKLAAAVVLSGPRVGTVSERVIAPEPEVTRRARSARIGVDEPPARAPVTKAVQARIAAMKAEAVRDRLVAFAREQPIDDLLGLVLLLFGADNLAVRTAAHPYGAGDNLLHLVAPLVAADGSAAPVGRDRLREIAIAVIGEIVAFDHPEARFSSGRVAEWIGRMIDAQLPRCDTAEILAGFSLPALREIASAHEIGDCPTARELRTRLVGMLPFWKAAAFGAPGPDPTPDNDNADEGAEIDDDGPPDDDDAPEAA
jgi:ParB/RepB/Spo0J family partition protein